MYLNLVLQCIYTIQSKISVFNLMHNQKTAERGICFNGASIKIEITVAV